MLADAFTKMPFAIVAGQGNTRRQAHPITDQSCGAYPLGVRIKL
jgi:hypothetical protein